MPINSLANNFSSIPSYGRDSRVRTSVLEIEDQSSERNKQPQAEVLATDNSEQVIQANRSEEPTLRAIPSFDDLPTSQRNALQTYLETEQANLLYSAAGSSGQQLVGVDTFV